MSSGTRKIRVLHITWSADKAGMLTDLVIAQRHDPSLDLDVCFGTRGEGIFSKKMEQLGIQPHYMGMRSRYALIDNVKGGVSVRRLLQRGNYDIIHLQEAMIPFPFLAAVSSSKAKIVLHSRGEFNMTETFRQRIAQSLKKVAYRMLVPGRVDRIICNSHFTLEKTPLARRFKSKVEVLYNAIDLSRIERIKRDREKLRRKICYENGLTGDAFIVTVVARLVEFKRIDRFIRAFSHSAQKEPRLISFIVGAGPLRKTLEADVSKFGLTGRIRFLGHRQDAKEITASSDLFVLPSVGEAFGIAALEAIALQIPVAVFTDAGGPLEFIRDGMNGYVAADEAELARILLGVARQEYLMKPSQADNSVYDIGSYARRIKQIYMDLME